MMSCAWSRRIATFGLACGLWVGAVAAPGFAAPESPASIESSPSAPSNGDSKLFKSIVIQAYPIDTEIVASGRYRSKNGVLEVPISAEAHGWPQSFTVTFLNRDYLPTTRVISNKIDWVRFFMVAGPATVVAAGYTLPLIDPSRATSDKFLAGLTVLGSLVTVGQIYFQSFKYDDVYTINLDKESQKED